MTRSIISLIGRTAVREMLKAAAAKAATENDETGGPRATRVNGRTVVIPGRSTKHADQRQAVPPRVRK